MPAGTGAWKLDELRRASGATFERNDDWWGGKTPLDGTEFTFFDETGAMVTAYQGGQIDAIVQFDVLSGASLFNDTNFTRRRDTDRRNHRQIWMRCDKGQFADKRVRQALALTIDRPALIQTAVQGQGASSANDHVICAVLSVLQRHGPAAGTGHRQGQAAPVGRRRAEPQRRPSSTASSTRSPTSPSCSRARPRRPGSPSRRPGWTTARSTAPSGARTTPADPPCSGAAELGIVDYGHRADPGRLPELGVQDQGRLELVAVLVAGVRRRVQGVPEPRSAWTPRRRPAPRSRRS